MSIERLGVDSNGRHSFTGVSSDTKGAGSLTLSDGSTVNYSVNSVFTETDTGDEYKFDGSNWDKTKTDGVTNVTDSPLTYITYLDATYQYYCEAKPGSARSDSVWQVMRKTLSDDTMVYAGNGSFEHAATNIATVTALSYTLGA